MVTVIQETQKQAITALHTGAWEVRNNCSGKGQWMIDKNTPVSSEICQALPMVVLGYSTFYGVVPAVNSFDDLDEAFKMMGINTKGFSPEDYYTTAYQRLAKYWGYVLFVPAPSKFTNPQTLPERVICGTLIKSTGLNKSVTGFMGNKGYLDQLQMAGLKPQDVITTASIEPTHVNPVSGGDVNGVAWRYALPFTKEEKSLVADIKNYLGTNFSILNSLLPKHTLRQCEEISLLQADGQTRLATEAKVMSRVFSFCPDLAALSPVQTRDILVEAVQVVEDDLY
jgi:hypothetical protein